MTGLRTWRTRQLRSVAELAAAAGITPKTLIDLEYGRRTPTFATMRRLSAALGVAPEAVAEFAAAQARRAARESHARGKSTAPSARDG